MSSMFSDNRNSILTRLSDADAERLAPELAPIDLPLRYRLADADRAIEHVYFLSRGIASVVAKNGHAPPIEIGIIGYEGMVNVAVTLGTDRVPSDAFMQVSGSGLRASADSLRVALGTCPSLREALGWYAHVFMTQTASTVLANGRASVRERLARWLLMAQDRMNGDSIALTHDFLATMLAVRRAGVSVALRDFEKMGLVQRNRGHILVMDRKGLLLEANGYYGTAEAEMRRLFDQPNAS